MKLRICVPYPNHGHISNPTERSIDILTSTRRDIGVEFVKIRGSSIPIGRNSGVNVTVPSHKISQPDLSGEGYDYYLALDADISFTPEQLQ